MSKSESLSSTLKPELEQMPLRGFRVGLKSDKPNWQKTILGMGDGRYKVAYTVIKK